MDDIRFRDPAGAVREGLLHDDHVHFWDDAYDLAEVDVLAPCEPSKIVCVGRNYAEHAEERGEDVPDRPLLFLKPPNAVASHGSTVAMPTGKEQMEHEAELAVVIDRQCRDVDPEDAEDVIRGYTAFDDISNRDDQSREQNWVRGKAFDGAAPMGPALTEEIPDDAAIRLRVNGEVRQDSSIEKFIFSIPELIAEITTYMTLEPGDVIATGTPEGVGPLEDGDHVEVDIEGVPTLEHDVVQPE